MTQAYLYSVERRGACDTYGIFQEAVERARYLAKLNGQEYHVMSSQLVVKPKEPILEESYPTYDPKINAPKEDAMKIAPLPPPDYYDFE